jgi:hypothetical protein
LKGAQDHEAYLDYVSWYESSDSHELYMISSGVVSPRDIFCWMQENRDQVAKVLGLVDPTVASESVQKEVQKAQMIENIFGPLSSYKKGGRPPIVVQ